MFFFMMLGLANNNSSVLPLGQARYFHCAARGVEKLIEFSFVDLNHRKKFGAFDSSLKESRQIGDFGFPRFALRYALNGGNWFCSH